MDEVYDKVKKLLFVRLGVFETRERVVSLISEVVSDMEIVNKIFSKLVEDGYVIYNPENKFDCEIRRTLRRSTVKQQIEKEYRKAEAKQRSIAELIGDKMHCEHVWVRPIEDDFNIVQCSKCGLSANIYKCRKCCSYTPHIFAGYVGIAEHRKTSYMESVGELEAWKCLNCGEIKVVRRGGWFARVGR